VPLYLNIEERYDNNQNSLVHIDVKYEQLSESNLLLLYVFVHYQHIQNQGGNS